MLNSPRNSKILRTYVLYDVVFTMAIVIGLLSTTHVFIEIVHRLSVWQILQILICTFSVVVWTRVYVLAKPEQRARFKKNRIGHPLFIVLSNTLLVIDVVSNAMHFVVLQAIFGVFAFAIACYGLKMLRDYLPTYIKLRDSGKLFALWWPHSTTKSR